MEIAVEVWLNNLDVVVVVWGCSNKLDFGVEDVIFVVLDMVDVVFSFEVGGFLEVDVIVEEVILEDVFWFDILFLLVIDVWEFFWLKRLVLLEVKFCLNSFVDVVVLGEVLLVFLFFVDLLNNFLLVVEFWLKKLFLDDVLIGVLKLNIFLLVEEVVVLEIVFLNIEVFEGCLNKSDVIFKGCFDFFLFKLDNVIFEGIFLNLKDGVLFVVSNLGFVFGFLEVLLFNLVCFVVVLFFLRFKLLLFFEFVVRVVL